MFIGFVQDKAMVLGLPRPLGVRVRDVNKYFDTAKFEFLNKLISETVCLLDLFKIKQWSSAYQDHLNFVRGLVSLDCQLGLLENLFWNIFLKK